MVSHGLDATTGRELWQMDYADVFQDEWGAGPRSTPILDGDRVYVQACNGECRCLSLADGKSIWGTNFEKDFAVKFLGSKANEGTATRRGNKAPASLTVTDSFRRQHRGREPRLLRQAYRQGSWKSGRSGLFLAHDGHAGGVREVVAFTADALLGADLATGRILWRVPLNTNAKRHAASPVTLRRHCGRQFAHHRPARLPGREGRRRPEGHSACQQGFEDQPRHPGAGRRAPLLPGRQPRLCLRGCRDGQLKCANRFRPRQEDYASTIAVGEKLLVFTEDGQALLLAATPEKLH